MDRWETIKIGTAIGLACAVWAGGSWFAGQLVAPLYPQQRGYAVEGVPPVDLAAVQRTWPLGDTAAERDQLLGYIGHIDKATPPILLAAHADAPPAADLGSLLASADLARGGRTAQACLACHDLSRNGPARIGPNLWGLVGRPVASQAGFAYSPALKDMGGQWSYQELDQFLAAPARAAPGTKMAFAGIRNPRERAHLIAFLATMGERVLPFPPPVPASSASAEPREAR